MSIDKRVLETCHFEIPDSGRPTRLEAEVYISEGLGVHTSIFAVNHPNEVPLGGELSANKLRRMSEWLTKLALRMETAELLQEMVDGFYMTRGQSEIVVIPFSKTDINKAGYSRRVDGLDFDELRSALRLESKKAEAALLQLGFKARHPLNK